MLLYGTCVEVPFIHRFGNPRNTRSCLRTSKILHYANRAREAKLRVCVRNSREPARFWFVLFVPSMAPVRVQVFCGPIHGLRPDCTVRLARNWVAVRTRAQK